MDAKILVLGTTQALEHAEVDCARQENKGLRAWLAAMKGERTAERERHLLELTVLRASLATAQQMWLPTGTG